VTKGRAGPIPASLPDFCALNARQINFYSLPAMVTLPKTKAFARDKVTRGGTKDLFSFGIEKDEKNI
jgi:hypothetical protein